MFDASILEVFIASTNDLKEERNAVEEVLRDWNSRNAQTRQIMLKPIRWEEDSTPELGPGSFQAVINQRLLAPADLLVGIVGKRLGSPTETSIAGTVEEIERFAAAKKPVLLYFSDRQFNLSDIDTQELTRVNEFKQAMQKRGLYLTFRDIADFKIQLRNHLDTMLADFQALLIPAGRALAYGYFKNFVAPTHTILRGGEVNLPDYPMAGADSEGAGSETGLTLTFSSFRIRIAKPVALEDATDDAVFSLRRNFLAEISLKTPSMRRAYRVYVPKGTKIRLDQEHQEIAERVRQGAVPALKVNLGQLDVIDFPTPLIALQEFVRYVERSLLHGKSDQSSAMGYWQKQKSIQYAEFFDRLDSCVEEDGKKGPSIGYFEFRNAPDFQLPE
jgi:hypothetical protein